MEKTFYYGMYFGVFFVRHFYKPTQDFVNHLLKDFKHIFSVGDYVKCKIPFKKNVYGRIERLGYSTEKNGGATIRVYYINGEWFAENLISLHIITK